MREAVRIARAAGATLVLLLAAAGCQPVTASLVEELARRDCRLDAPTRVDDSRIAYLFAHNHVYHAVGDDLAGWATGLVNAAVPQAFDDLNPYLAARGVNIALLPLRSFVVRDDRMAPVHVDAGGRPQEPSRSFIYETSAAEPKLAHTYWSPSATTPGLGGYGGGVLPDKVYVGIVERPDRPRAREVLRRALAHETAHFLGLGHTTTPGNLMSAPSGDDLTPEQVASMRRAVNTTWTELMVMSCLADPALRTVVEKHAPDEVLKAATNETRRRQSRGETGRVSPR